MRVQQHSHQPFSLPVPKSGLNYFLIHNIEYWPYQTCVQNLFGGLTTIFIVSHKLDELHIVINNDLLKGNIFIVKYNKFICVYFSIFAV